MFKITRIAVISDIHGNYLALDSILNETKNLNIDKYVFCGDLINEFPFGNKVLDTLRSLDNAYIIKGNREQYLIEYDEEKYEWDNIQFKNNLFMYNELRPDNLEYIKSLPETLSFKAENVSFKVVHGSVDSINEFIHDDSIDRMAEMSEEFKEDVLLLGHSHQRIWYQYINNKLFINAGCCGVSKLNNEHAEYLILTVDVDDVQIEPRNVWFNVDELIEEVKKSGIIEVENVFVNLSLLGITGKGHLIHEFFRRAKEEMSLKGEILHLHDAKGIYKDFRLYDDDVWLKVAEEFKDEFIIK